MAARLHRPAARRLPEPRLRRPAPAGTSTSRSAAAEYADLAAELARGGRADRGRLLRRAARAHRRAARARVRDTPRGDRHGEPALPRSAGTPGGRSRRRPRARPWLDDARPHPLPARRCPTSSRPGVFVPDPGQLPGVEAPVPRGRRRGPALPRRRLRHAASSRSSSRSTAPSTCTRSTSTAEAVANTLANAFRNGVADRISGARRSTCTPGCPRRVRRGRGQHVPDAGRPVRAGRPAPAARLLGPQPARPPDHAAAAAAGGGRRRLPDAALDPEPAAHGRAARRARARRRAPWTSASSPGRRSSRTASRSSGSRSSPTPTTCASAPTTSRSPTCSRSAGPTRVPPCAQP